MASEIEYLYVGDYVDSLPDNTETPAVDDRTVVFNSEDGFRKTKSNANALDDEASESDLNASSVVEIWTPEGKKKLPGDVIATKSEAKNFADGFSELKNYAFGAVTVKDGLYLRAVENIVAGAFNPEQWESSNLEKSHQFNVTADTLSHLGDADTFPANSQVSCFNTGIAQQVSHIPVSDQFVCYTFLSGEATPAMQLFICKNANEVYFRRKWSTWGTWERLAFASEAENLADRFSAYKNYSFGNVVVKDGHYLRAVENIVAGAFNPEQWESSNLEKSHQFNVTADTLSHLGDADTFPANSQVRCFNTGIAQQVSHIPVSTQFVCYTFLSGEATPAMQLFIINNANEVYFRRKWSTWGNWEKLAFASETGDDGVNVLGAFDNIVAIGDSLTYSQVYTSASTKRQAKHTWPEILANYCGADYQVIAQPGYTAADAWTLVNAELVQKTNGIAIMYLGTNYGLTETLDADAPSNLPYTEWASSNTGCYAKIIAKAQSLGYKVMLLKPWSTSGSGDSSLEHTNATIDAAGSRFGCAVVEPFRASDVKYHYYPDLSGSNNVHYNDLGYAWFATKLISKVTKLGNDNMKFIIPS